MSEVTLVPGCIFHWKEYKFPDGSTANKYFVLVGAKTGSNYLAVIATSQRHKRDFQPGCNAKDGYYHIPGGKKDWFPQDTWLLIAEPKELEVKAFMKFAMTDKAITLSGNLREQIANEIKNCMKKCDDVSEAHRALL